ncbi:stage III sporulation protein AH [Reticulomyxa filosa]|uniref:Stage III sporulation protein AH n=1 Tax=Reticulomyxa filosa TaxID=46433 RepID=X6MXM0_RETFI|nr:stage III sporulation protein AH [Reticulomyxa filosa]|eukprot:ETO17820.1 stage III sporulation protein AH [Reticulomyxa filosa]
MTKGGGTRYKKKKMAEPDAIGKENPTTGGKSGVNKINTNKEEESADTPKKESFTKEAEEGGKGEKEANVKEPKQQEKEEQSKGKVYYDEATKDVLNLTKEGLEEVIYEFLVEKNSTQLGFKFLIHL